MIIATLDRADTLSVERSSTGGLLIRIGKPSGAFDASLLITDAQAASLVAALMPWLSTEGA